MIIRVAKLHAPAPLRPTCVRASFEGGLFLRCWGYVQYLIEKITNLKINHARSRKTLRKTYLKIKRKVRARSMRKLCARSLGRASDEPRTTLRRPWTTLGRPSNDIRKQNEVCLKR